MKVKDFMNVAVESCDPCTPIAVVAEKMMLHDCGLIPLTKDGKPIGVITDRDIVIRLVAAEREPRETRAGDIMSARVVSIGEGASLEECCGLMGQHKLRRLLVVNNNDELVGLVSTADIARNSDPHDTGRLMKLISEPEEAVAC